MHAILLCLQENQVHVKLCPISQIFLRSHTVITGTVWKGEGDKQTNIEQPKANNSFGDNLSHVNFNEISLLMIQGIYFPAVLKSAVTNIMN